MPVELKVPSVGESVTEVQIARWLKGEGEEVQKDENLVEIESDKATVELPAPIAGRIAKVLKNNGETAAVGEIIGYMEENGQPGKAGAKESTKPPLDATAEVDDPKAVEKKSAKKGKKKDDAESVEATVPVSELRGGTAIGSPRPKDGKKAEPAAPRAQVMPAAARALHDEGLSADEVEASGPGGRLLKGDLIRHSENNKSRPPETQEEKPTQISQHVPARGLREEEYVPMSPLRRKIAERLVSAQQTAALLTTFNEIDMTEVMALRQKYRDVYQERYGIKLGFMSFFVKASVDALKHFPQVNAEIREPHIVYHNYYDIGIAVGGGKGLVVPVLRNTERMSFGEIELAIADFARRAQANKLKLEELQGGTFTISNGGVYGSLLSTPIINPPQSGILGLHAIQERPIALKGQVVIRPMMYIALTYDHRIVDGREAVTFLKRIKETIEDPSRILLEV